MRTRQIVLNVSDHDVTRMCLALQRSKSIELERGNAECAAAYEQLDQRVACANRASLEQQA